MATGFFAKLQAGLSKTRDNIVKGLDNVFALNTEIDEDFYEELEEVLIMGDIGINATSRIIDELREQVREQGINDTKACRALLLQDIWKQMKMEEGAYDFEDQKSVIFIIGVNGVGKTTSVGKLASIFRKKGKKVLIAAADTYRAAATEQLEEWAKRAETPIITGREGADPASVIYDACSAFKARDCDILIVDTAGRLHNKKNLMEELAKMNRIIDREAPDANKKSLLIIDATTGQNAVLQTEAFSEAVDLDYLGITKLDGSAKGGVAIAVSYLAKVPIVLAGLGEGVEDLMDFDPQAFADALIDT